MSALQFSPLSLASHPEINPESYTLLCSKQRWHHCCPTHLYVFIALPTQSSSHSMSTSLPNRKDPLTMGRYSVPAFQVLDSRISENGTRPNLFVIIPDARCLNDWKGIEFFYSFREWLFVLTFLSQYN